MERGSDSDGEDAMAYFLPNGIADDSPPKRSALAAPPSFGPIGGRFGGVYGASAPPPAPGTRDLSTPLFGGLGGPGAAASTPAPARPSFLLSDLGGEILEPPATDAPGGKAIGGGRNPFAFSGAFASLAAESDSMGRPASNSIDFVDDPRGDFVGTPKASASGFRSDAEIFPPASSGGMGAVYGRATLNANAPAFMASSAHESAPYGSSSPSAWPTMNVKPRRAPPGLSKPTEDVSLRGGQAGDGGGPLSLPPGLARPSQMSSFSGFASTSASLFSGEGVRHFASKLQPSLTSLSDAFRSGGATRESDFQSPLSELNAKSLSVEEVQSNLKATAIAAAQDVVSEAPVQKAQREITPRSGAKRSIEFKSPPGIDEKRGVDINNRVGTEPRSRTPSRRNEATGTVIAASPTAIPRSDRRGRNAKEPVAVEATRPSRQPAVESTSRSGRRARGGQNHNVPSGETKSTEGPATTAPESSSRSHEPSSRKKPPSSVSSAGSDDQLLTVSTLVEPVSEARIGPGPAKIKESPRETKASNRGGTKKSIVPLVNDKRGVPKRQIYREKIPVAEPLKEQKDEAVQSNKPEDGDQARLGADGCVIDGAVSETPKRESIMAVPHTDVSEREEKSTQSQDPIVMDVEENEETPLEIQSMPSSQSEDSPAPPSPAPTEEQDTIGDGAESADTSSFVPTDEDKPSGSEPTLEPSGATAVTRTPPSYIESDSGSEIPEVVLRAVRAGPSSDRKTSTKKDKHKKEKVEKKKSVSSAKSNKKEKRDSSSSGKGDLADDEPFSTPAPKKPSMPTTVKVSGLLRDARFLLRRSVAAVWSAFWFLCVEFADRVNLKGFLGWSFSYLESFLAVVFSVILLLSLHGASFFIRLHRVAFRAVLTHRHVGFCFAFLYAFPYLVQYVFPWAPPWAPVCLWYAFLVQLFCTSGPTAMVATFRVVLPLVFLIEGISHHSFLLDLNGAELLLASFILSAMKTSNLCSPIFLLSLAVQCLSAVFLGSELVVQWFQLTLALYSLHAMAASDEDWAGLGDEDEDVSCRPISMHHSIADYNYHPAPSAPSIQKTKRLDRRALAYVRGRKFR